MSKKSLKLLLSFSLVAILSLVVVWGVRADDEGVVTCTVTAQEIAVSVSDGAVAYGTLDLDTSAGTNSSDTQTATNDGNVDEDFEIKGQNSTSWTLAATSGAENYVHRFCTSSCTSPPTSYTPLTTDYQELALSVASTGNQTFDLYITTPTSTSDYTEQSVDVTVLASAS